MVNKIKETYRLFSDSIIHKIEYTKTMENTICIVNMSSYNWLTQKYDKINIILEECSYISFFEDVKNNSTVITNALLKEEDGNIIFDFFPLYYSDIHIIENPNSDFKIKAKRIKIIH